MSLIEPKKILAKGDGVEKEIVISKLPATVGMDVVLQLPSGILPKIGDYKVIMSLRSILMKYTAVEIDAGGQTVQQTLSSDTLINNHIPNAEMLMGVLYEMLKYNYGFFRNGKISGFLTAFESLAKEKAIEMLTSLLDNSSVRGAQASKS